MLKVDEVKSPVNVVPSSGLTCDPICKLSNVFPLAIRLSAVRTILPPGAAEVTCRPDPKLLLAETSRRSAVRFRPVSPKIIPAFEFPNPDAIPLAWTVLKRVIRDPSSACRLIPNG